MYSCGLHGCILLLLFTLGVTPAEAQKPFRCSGRIQFYPCDQILFPTRTPAHPAVSPAIPEPGRAALSGQGVQGRLFAQVTKQSYQRANRSTGWWRGTIRGNGTVHLELQILRNGLLESTRYMGNVRLLNKATWFSFRSPLPAGRGWTWKIRAFAT